MENLKVWSRKCLDTAKPVPSGVGAVAQELG
jgi:hypothetical protein